VQIFGKSAKYAICAVRVVLSRPAGELTPATEITKELAGSPTYIGKVLQTLVRSEILGSRKGARGGFYLKRPPNEITLWDLVSPFEDFSPNVCAMDGGKLCSGSMQCGMHGDWAKIREQVEEKLKQTTLLQLHRADGSA
jgi:Rrf2 family protein